MAFISKLQDGEVDWFGEFGERKQQFCGHLAGEFVEIDTDELAEFSSSRLIVAVAHRSSVLF
jgi:hypothetical protein